MKKITALIVLLLMVSSVSAFSLVTGRFISARDLLDDPEAAKENYNENIESVSGFVKNLFGNELIKLNVDMNNETARVIFIKTENGMIMYINNSVDIEPTLLMKTNEDTINEISASVNQIDVFNAAIEDGRLTYKTNAFMTGFKVGVAKTLFTVASWFS